MKILNINEHDFELKYNFILPGTTRSLTCPRVWRRQQLNTIRISYDSGII